MFGFGNKKRIEELERQYSTMIDLLDLYSGRIESELDSIRENCAKCKCPIDEETAEICFNCRIKTGVRTKEIKAVGVETITTHYIPAKEAIEKIMDHLCLEFDHIDAKPSDTVIKPKETP